MWWLPLGTSLSAGLNISNTRLQEYNKEQLLRDKELKEDSKAVLGGVGVAAMPELKDLNDCYAFKDNPERPYFRSK